MIQSSSVILLVDDDENDVFFLKKALHQAGIRQSIQVLRDGEAAIDYLAGTAPFGDRLKYPLPCLVLLDTNMPKKSGMEVLKWLRQQAQFKDLPVFMTTSSGKTGDIDAANKYGIRAFLTKPLDYQHLVILVREFLLEADAVCQESAAPGEPPPCAKATAPFPAMDR